jgi:hypothetical protein
VRLYGIIVNAFRTEYDGFHIKSDRQMTDGDWQDRVKGLLKAELKKKGVSYAQLAEKMTAMGVPESERNISNKLSRGSFTAVFFVQCLIAIGTHTIRLHDPE